MSVTGMLGYHSAKTWGRPQVDPTIWITGIFDGEPLVTALRRRDIAVVFRFLGSQGWSRAAIAAATGLTENRVRAIVHRRQIVVSFDVLERIAIGLKIDRGLMGLAYYPAAPEPVLAVIR